ncbi:DUF2264 domain-containing protein [Actinoplanes sp. CA-252034]|uniref:DUF2264 domain-containing protein n=1 Tax=Actinoplanes sp. CA-252034 TaxID=3239906 RepID=UPI003D990ED5
MPLHLPPEDRDLSPSTGWTRAHWEAVAGHLLTAVEPYATDGHARYRLPGAPSRNGVTSDGLEGFARTFLLAAFAGTHLDRYATGLIAGVRGGWPPLTDMAQPIVEAAGIAIALHETRSEIFDRLAPADRERVVDWLAGMVGKRTPDSNWVLFRVIVEQFLATVGGPHDPAEIAGGLDRIDAWHTRDGWYSDGPGRNFDYYSGWALHLYPVLWARMTGDHGRWTGRVGAFLDGYQHFFAADGRPVFQGRSLAYRFATVAPLWLGPLTGSGPLSPGRTRRIASGVLRHFLGHGALDEHGLLTLGWHRPFPPMIQPYSGPASPYWASKAFLGLLLPAEHPVWTATEEPAEIELRDVTVHLPGPNWLLHGTRADGVVRLLNHGSDRARTPADPHYVRLAYSTHTAPQLDPESWTDPVDGHLAVIGPDGHTSIRSLIEPTGAASSAYRDGPVEVVTASATDGAFEVRVHRVTAPAGFRVRDGGYALAGSTAPARVITGSSAEVSTPSGLHSAITALVGLTGAGVRDRCGADAFAERSATPYLTAVHPGGTALYASLVRLGGGPAGPSPEVTTRSDETVDVRWAGGDTVTLRIAERPAAAG